LLRFRTSMIASPAQREGSFVGYYWFLDCSCCWFITTGLETLQEIISP
jgi:hypothetical protein